ncbi:DNA topoisomerase 3 [Balneatrix alpica]|uniref:DNA topoisomerase n=1 Tax=Balneatrix alpica TaxID=75684 RepID=A0ABV5Z805_9GAMM|nr:DNA topoisomerase 3 [Balneatrix alpica]
MRLFLCEKPSLAREVAKALGGGRTAQGYIEGQGWRVTWLFGHMYELAPPEVYHPHWKPWTLIHLPMLPENWQRLPRKGVSAQLKVIRSCLKQATEVVNAGDTGREGELLIRELLEEMHWRGPLWRLWHHSLELPVLQRALAQLRQGSEFDALLAAAKARQYSDWLVGMNCSRAYTLKAKQQGGQVLISVGRVQSPTLALVVARDRQIDDFAYIQHFQLQGSFVIAGVQVQAQWQPDESLLSEQGYLLQPQPAEQLAARLPGAAALLTQLQDKVQRSAAPLPFSLSKLQAYASKRFGYGAQQTLDGLQALYEKHKLLSYPRTDCEYLSEAQWQDVARQRQALSALPEGEGWLAAADWQRRPPCYNDTKVGEHTAIVPTGQRPQLDKLSQLERNLYLSCALRWLMQFYPPLQVRRWQLQILCLQQRFEAQGREVLAQGWRQLDKPLESDWPAHYHALAEGQQGVGLAAQVQAKQTEPPAPYTDGTLIAAMANVAKLIEDAELKAKLKEAKGIGEESSRAGIIELLLERGYLQRQGKSLRSTTLGKQVVDVLLPQLTSPVLTARWERGLALVEAGEMSLEEFMQHQQRWLTKVVEGVKQQSWPLTEPMSGQLKRVGKGRRKASKSASKSMKRLKKTAA